MSHFWQGTWVTDEAAEQLLDGLEQTAAGMLRAPRLRQATVLAACDRLAERLAKPDDELRLRLTALLRDWGVPEGEAARTFTDLPGLLAREELERKVVRELGGVDPARLGRLDYRHTSFEAWVPVGLLVHIASGNAPAVGALSVVEGLLSGNLNVVKASGSDSRFTAELLAALAALDPTGAIAERIIVLHFSSARREWLRRIIEPADAVAAWGGEEALSSIAELVAPGTRLIEWGPKLSFAYLTSDVWDDRDVLRGVAADICRLDQQACSSPQVIYLDTADQEQVFAFAERFATVLASVVPGSEPREPDAQEWAEITSTTLVAELEEHLGLTRVHAAADGSWRVIADVRDTLRASPLYRSVWVKPLPRKDITTTLRPMRRYLQTVGLGANRQDTAELARTLVSTGAQRVTVPGNMLDSYAGEPHDGVYALQRYSRRVDVQLDERFATDAVLDDLADEPQLPAPDVPVTRKADFESLQSDQDGRGEVFFLSGGSSGKPKLSAFSWADYDEHMTFGAEGLLASGLDPRTDRVMNLFFVGRLYGGFISYFSTLQVLGAVQFPMSADPARLPQIAESIVDNRVDTLVVLPTFAVQLFTECADVLRRYRGVRKIFFAGESFAEAQVRWLREEFGVQTVRSAVYGSIDAGPMGFGCLSAPPRVHHLFTGLHTLEILDEQDQPVGGDELGRLVFTAHTRRGQRLDRYEIGDLGRWVPGQCGCGRRSPRFELAGRVGDVFRTEYATLNHRVFAELLAEKFDYTGGVQSVLDGTRSDGKPGEQLTVRVRPGIDQDAVRQVLLEGNRELAEAVRDRGWVQLTVEQVPESGFARTTTSGKLIGIVDNRYEGNA